MKLLHFAVFIGLFTFVGCEENEVDRDMPATMPGQPESDIDDGINNDYGIDDEDEVDRAPVPDADPGLDQGVIPDSPGTPDPLNEEPSQLGEDPAFSTPENTSPSNSGLTPPTPEGGAATTPPAEGEDDPDVVKEVDEDDQP